MRMFAIACLVFPDLQEQLPQDGKEDTLQTVRNDSCFQASSEQPQPTILSNNALCSLGVGYLGIVNLTIRLDYT